MPALWGHRQEIYRSLLALSSPTPGGEVVL